MIDRLHHRQTSHLLGTFARMISNTVGLRNLAVALLFKNEFVKKPEVIYK